ncbi:MAG: selenide, water dikinase [Hydrocarboniphaga sp.]|uniref:selenide, water dikinase SelD n=1 Tax=Hydrocarboniphaga sp. TaxID=2033016 RepID=UPI00262A15C4|nr:selenide, water dikinase SelD [Hydrocarboniphaga sp.]MDB5970387.1 selenide, water dikinase [Hydrocarboniphaga sp.]
MADFETRLTALAHGGGCGCKLSPAVLREILAGMPTMQAFPDLLVGIETGDDAAVYRINDQQAIVATTDFFTPIVDDPFDFGRIAAANALSDVYAMGGRPLLALAILGMPLGKIAPESVRTILAGGAAVCAEAGIPVAGGHSIDSPEPIYGLAVIGLVNPKRVLRNTGAQSGDVLILSKALGVGVISAALKSGKLDAEAERALYATLVDSTTRLNAVGHALAAVEPVHAMTDVTGFGLLGHGLEMCRGSRLRARIRFDALPLLDGVAELARVPYRTGAANRNWASYGEEVTLAPDLEHWKRDLLCDPQTSGGLLVAVAADGAAKVLERLRAAGFDRSAVIGEMRDGSPAIEII